MNELANATSPYLRQHAGNPVHWKSWSPELIREAALLGKPVLVSIGYSTCHWCHVMAHESFENPDVAGIMNRHFINIKIDREERPDLDAYFMTAVQAIGISGGWPLHCFLDGEGRPFYGGTYFPPVERYGRPSWSQVLLATADAFQHRSSELAERARRIASLVDAQMLLSRHGTSVQGLPDWENLCRNIMELADRDEGGFGHQPRFPQASLLRLLMRLRSSGAQASLVHHACFTLERMIGGGIFDQLAGGFCRYAVDGNWNVPHFEKMLYDHAQIVESLALAWQHSGNSLFRWAADRSIHFFENEMRHPAGYYFAAMDADSNGEEGAYYTWRTREIDGLLGEWEKPFWEVYASSPLDAMHPDLRVLRLKLGSGGELPSVENILALDESRQRLLEERSRRLRPQSDQKGIVAWNAMLVSAYFSWYRVSGEEAYSIAGKRLLHTLLEHAFHSNGKLCRYLYDARPVGLAFLEDYAFLIKACIECHQLDFDQHYLERAQMLFDETIRLFKMSGSGLLRSNAAEHGQLPGNVVEWTDGNYPSANAVCCWAARQLAALTGAQVFVDFQRGILREVNELALQHPLASASWIGELLADQIGNPVLKTAMARDAWDQLRSHPIPEVSVVGDPGGDRRMMICAQGVCHPPVVDLAEGSHIIDRLHILRNR
jgi:uncharacterized protein YyaL (SSP411 family)